MSVKPGYTDRCPHCAVSVRFEPVSIHGSGNVLQSQSHVIVRAPSNHGLALECAACPACGKPIVIAASVTAPGAGEESINAQLWPDTGARPVPQEVVAAAPKLAADFREAVAVFPKSKKASAALSRRCLQFILVEKGGAKSRDLADQIDEVLGRLPPSIAENVDAIRHVGNFALHPIKSKNSGEIADVEVGEAEWLLDVLEELFEFYYVAPAQAADRRAALNKKLADLGKPPLKSAAPQNT